MSKIIKNYSKILSVNNLRQFKTISLHPAADCSRGSNGDAGPQIYQIKQIIAGSQIYQIKQIIICPKLSKIIQKFYLSTI